ncbi:cytochrome P450 [Xylariaceae sp. FL0016]|nr:cytochrome P450 [Xylariaceae sp. FL0016]
MAAHDTTSEILTNVLFLLVRHPMYWELLRKELVGMETGLNVDVLLGSRLFENILHETLRLWPIFLLLGKVILRDAKLPIGGGLSQDQPVYISQGSTVVLSHYALHRNTMSSVMTLRHSSKAPELDQAQAMGISQIRFRSPSMSWAAEGPDRSRLFPCKARAIYRKAYEC